MKRTFADISSADTTSDAEHQESDEDEDGAIQPYDAVLQERLPESPVYSTTFRELKNHIKNFVDLLLRPIQETEYRNAVIGGLKEKVEKRSKGGSPENVCIALIGQMAAGKSSVINSLLSIGIIARQGDGSKSCTWVTQEFCYKFPTQTMSHAAQVHFFNQAERHGIIKALLADYHNASTTDQDARGEAIDTEQKSADFATMKTTVDAFCALFAEHRAFGTTEEARKTLGTATGPDDKALLSRLYMWADTLVHNALKGRASVFEEASTPQSLLFQLGKFCYTVGKSDGAPQASLWPFISHIKFGLDNRLLQHGISLLDVPGLSDTNRIRVSNAMRHLQRCTHGMVVAEVSRSEDEGFIRTSFVKGFHERGSGRTMGIFTYADEIDENTEVDLTAREQEHIARIEDNMLEIDEEKIKVSRLVKASKKAQKWQYMAQKAELEGSYRRAEAETLEIRSKARSRGVIQALQTYYGELTPDPLPLPAWCVGNKAYKKHQVGYKTTDAHLPTLSVEATNTPAVRKHLYLIPAEGLINETKNLVKVQIPILLSCFQLFVNKTHMARRDEIEAIVLKPQTEVIEAVDELFKAIWKDVKRHVLMPYKDEEYKWTRDAKAIVDGWAIAYDTGTHLAMLKNKGRRKGKGKNAMGISWCYELLEINQAEVEIFHRDLSDAFREYPKQMVSTFEGLVQEMANEIHGDLHLRLLALKPFLDYILNEKQHIERLVDDIVRSLRRGFGGKVGTPRERLEKFEEAITQMGDGVWHKATMGLSNQFKRVLREHTIQLKSTMMAYFANIHKNFNMLCADPNVKDEAEDELREKLKKSVITAEELLEREIKPRMEVCLGKSEQGLFVEQE
ncbi:hypothetical protein LTR78_009062 [Recurvomyces mirabilis]|uniref:Dynamin N-terminal domain-containing protein n=1 Tax=Recurvomyces mirabilis TaxID=574656 RepID=A0AAE0TU46_9PEZI|nr:hypothetical protein LTR78_009062 [Recurvomyces mirabilis]KAK5150409.1 hypothetical protein LTS14_010099 [Recurvomyces mirabilis]